MIPVTKIQDAFIASIVSNITGVKSVKPHESEFDEKQPGELLVLAPFVLLRYGGLTPEPGERLSNGASGVKKMSFFLSVGASTLLSKKEGQHGCYSILDDLRLKYDGGVITTDEGQINLSLEGEAFVHSGGGLIVYAAEYSYYDN